MNEIEIKLSQENIDFINDTCQKELQYWKKVALQSVSTENGRKQLTDLVHTRVWLIRKAVINNAKNVHEIIFYLNCQYLTRNEERLFKIFRVKKTPSFEAITDYLKTFSKSVKKDKNMGLKDKVLFGG